VEGMSSEGTSNNTQERQGKIDTAQVQAPSKGKTERHLTHAPPSTFYRTQLIYRVGIADLNVRYHLRGYLHPENTPLTLLLHSRVLPTTRHLQTHT
jgi:hypothetical protein